MGPTFRLKKAADTHLNGRESRIGALARTTGSLSSDSHSGIQQPHRVSVLTRDVRPPASDLGFLT
jgi:hypothetical protein